MKQQNSSKAFSLIELSIVILIIGIIIAGVTQGSRLVVKMRLNTARNFTQSSDVSSIKDLVFWLDATREGVFTNSAGLINVDNNDLIQAWQSYNPQYATAINFIQATSGLMPTYLDSGINNLPTLYFDAATNAASGKTLTAAFSPDLNTNQFTMFVVVKPMEATTDFGTIVMNRSDGPLYGLTLYKNQTTPDFVAMSGNGAWTAITTTFTNFNTSYITSTMQDSSNFSFYLNGGTGTTSATTYIPQTVNSFKIGSNNVSGSYFDGQISEIILYARALKSEERKSVEKYLAKKYAIKIS